MSTTDLEQARAARTWRRAMVNEVRSRPIAYGVLVVFVLAGPIVTRLLFPEAPLGVGIAGGLAFGLYAALCAVPQKFL